MTSELMVSYYAVSGKLTFLLESDGYGFGEQELETLGRLGS